MRKALLVFSGGQDSTTCLYWALDEYGPDNVLTLTFDYGQRHRVELQCAEEIAALAGVEHTVLPIDTLSVLGGNSLTGNMEIESKSDSESGLPNTFVPGRNLIFLTYAAAFAYQRGIQNIVTGVAQTDYSGYPDCREETIKALEKTIKLGMEAEISIHTPLMNLSKKQTVELAHSLAALPMMAYTHTCYEGLQPPCGECAACVLRAKGFQQAGQVDPLLVRFKKK